MKLQTQKLLSVFSLFKKIAFLLILLFFHPNLNAAVISNTSVEVNFSYEAKFITSDFNKSALTLIDEQSSHMFGVFHSESLIAQHGLNSLYTGGIAAPFLPFHIQIQQDQILNTPNNKQQQQQQQQQ